MSGMNGATSSMGAAACAAGLANLPGMSPAGLVELLKCYGPQEAWQAVLAGVVRRPGSGRGGSSGGGDRLPGLDSHARATGHVLTRTPGAWGGRETRGDGTGQTAWVAQRPRRGGGAERVPWAVLAGQADLAGWWDGCRSRGIEVTWWGDTRYPAALLHDPEPPGVVFWRGRLDWLERPCVALVGTRRATPDGRAVAFELGRDLAAAGVCVVSGLALGIDAAAHTGALNAASLDAGAAGTVGVAASGVDVVYPRQHRQLWEKVVAQGAVLSETAPGRPAQSWRFPARNRIIAGLVRMVVVVESHQVGGSLLTANAALERGVELRAVPGPVHSPASAGSNQLLYDGPGPVRHAQDILDGLGDFRSPPVGRPTGILVGGLGRGSPGRASDPKRSPSGGAVPQGSSPREPASPNSGAGEPASRSSPAGTRGHSVGGRERPAEAAAPSTVAALSAADIRILDAVGWRPSTLAQVVERTGLGVGEVGRRLEELDIAGLLTAGAGWWVRRSGARPSS